ncbi:MAG: TIM44-like domain-containing protein [Lachnospiraceae bacterium]|nr:TIM44-like domain-containing protein [Lachnospiraceae bacterium]
MRFVVLGIFAAVFATAAIGVLVIKNRLQKFSRQVFGTDTIAEGLNRQADLAAERPKSVSGMTRIFLPQIQRDFPDFSWEEFKHKAENMLVSALAAISKGQVSAVKDASEDIRQQIENQIADNRAAGVREGFREVRIHQTEIADYRKEKGTCSITIQSAVEYYHDRMAETGTDAGKAVRKTQTKYNLELLYIQDSELAGMGNAITTNCPNCGAPVRSLGTMVCEFCGTAVTPINIKVWSLHKFYEVDYNHIR